MTPSHAVRLAKYHHRIEGGLPPLAEKEAKFIAKALGIKGTHRVGGGHYHPGENEYILVEALNSYNHERTKWEKRFGAGSIIAIPNNGTTKRD